MTEMGFEYVPPVVYERVISREDPTEWVFPVESEFRAEHGYGWTLDATRALESTRLQEEELEQALAQSGTDLGPYFEAQSICYETAGQELSDEGLFAASPEVDQQMDELFDRYFAELNRDPQVRDAEEEWARCMLGEGYPDATSPQTFRLDIAAIVTERVYGGVEDSEGASDTASADEDRPLGGEVEGFEIEAAEADAACQENTTLAITEVYMDLADAVFGTLG